VLLLLLLLFLNTKRESKLIPEVAFSCDWTHAQVLEPLIKGIMTRLMVDALSELCSPFLKGGNSAFIAGIASGLFPQNEYRSLE